MQRRDIDRFAIARTSERDRLPPPHFDLDQNVAAKTPDTRAIGKLAPMEGAKMGDASHAIKPHALKAEHKGSPRRRHCARSSSHRPDGEIVI